MNTWQDRCVDVITLMERNFPETRYRIVFHKDKAEIWQFVVESIRSDGGPHSGTAISWVSINATDIDKLPQLLLEKCEQRLREYIDDGVNKVREQVVALEKARVELDKRTGLMAGVEHLKEKIT